MEKIRLIIICEDNAARKGLNAIFGAEEAFDILDCLSLQEAAKQSISLQPDLILIDVTDLKIAQCGPNIRLIKHDCPCSIIIALVENEQSSHLTGFLAEGIDSCVPKGIMRGCLVKITEIACRARVFCMPGSFKNVVSSGLAQAEKPGHHINLGQFCNNDGGITEALTKRETEILELMAANYSNREIAGKLFISEPTVKTHVSNILRKLGQSNRAQAVVYSFRMGLVNDKQIALK